MSVLNSSIRLGFGVTYTWDRICVTLMALSFVEFILASKFAIINSGKYVAPVICKNLVCKTL